MEKAIATLGRLYPTDTDALAFNIGYADGTSERYEFSFGRRVPNGMSVVITTDKPSWNDYRTQFDAVAAAEKERKRLADYWQARILH